MSENRVDPTVAGLFLVALITLIFGILGIDLFNDLSNNGLLTGAAMPFIPLLSAIFIVLAYMAGKAGNAFATALFVYVAVALYGVIVAFTMGSAVGDAIMLALAFFFLMFTLVAFMIGAPKLLGFLLLCVTLLYLFVSIFINQGGDDEPYAIAFGIFGILAFLISSYLAIALATQKLPVI